MAEKEERILIKKQINYHPPYGGWRGDGKGIVLTRQEAIERMAKAICLCDGGCKGVCNPKCEEWKYSLYHAEAALNALLVETK